MVELAEAATYVLGAVSATALSIGAKKMWTLDVRSSRTEDLIRDLQEGHGKTDEMLREHGKEQSSLQVTMARTCERMDGLVAGQARIEAHLPRIGKLAEAQVGFAAGQKAHTAHISELANAQKAHTARLDKLAEAQAGFAAGQEGHTRLLEKIEKSAATLSGRVAALETRQDAQQATMEEIKARQDAQQATLERIEKIVIDMADRLRTPEVR